VVATRCVTAVTPQKGETVLVVGAPGGVGSFAVQLAAERGAHVIASGLADDVDYLRELGAEEVLEPGPGLVDAVRERHPDGIDGLIDLVDYRAPFMEHVVLLGPGGRAASTHRAVDDELMAQAGVTGTNVGSAPDPALLDELGSLAAAGRLLVSITRRHSLEEAAKALEEAREGHSRGRRVLTMER
jgi:NADPH:quinone reductase-like Zn-dependent oxidoreductase